MTDLLTVTEAARVLGVSDRTVWTLIGSRRLIPDPDMRRFRRTLLCSVAVEALRKERASG